MAKVLAQAEGGALLGMEAHLDEVEEVLCRLLQPVEMVPPAMVAQLRLEEVPNPLDQVELRRIRREPEGEEPRRQFLPAGVPFTSFCNCGSLFGLLRATDLSA